jgi:hypothetical protein
VLRVIVLTLLASALCACGSTTTAKAPAAKETRACRVMTTAAVDDVRQLLHDYGGNAPPADLPFYDLREDITNIQARCRPAWLGAAIAGAFTSRRLATLYALLPSTYVAYLRLAVGCSRSDTAACDAGPHSIHSPGATGTGNTPHPVKP